MPTTSTPIPPSTSTPTRTLASSSTVLRRQWPPRLYLAVDCGGTKAAAVICDELGNIVGRGHGGPSNYTDVGLLFFLNSVEEAVVDALRRTRRHFLELPESVFTTPTSSQSLDPSAIMVQDEHGETSRASCSTIGPSPYMTNHSKDTITEGLAQIRLRDLGGRLVEPPSFGAAWFGIAGVDSPADVTALTPHLASLLSIPYPSQKLIVANDTSLLASPVTDPSRPNIKSGVVAIAGTGSIVMSFRQRKDGLLRVLGRVGGFGWLLGDEGSGYQVGKSAVRSILDLADRERLAADEEGCYAIPKSPLPHDVVGEEYSGDGMGVAHAFAATADTTEIETNSTLFPKASHKLPKATKEAPYGHVLRDRILQHWGLVSTDELLRAVYFGEKPQHSSPKTGQPTASGGDLKADKTTNGVGVVPSPLSAAEPSANLLPPIAPTLDVETQLRGASPIPSLSSSPTGSSQSGASGHTSKKNGSNGHHRPPTNRSHSDSSANANGDESPVPSVRPIGERKHRLASLAPLVFHLAFNHNDEMSLHILRTQAHYIAVMIGEILRPPPAAHAHVKAEESVLCMGGSLVGVERYRQLLVEQLDKLGYRFAYVEYVGDPARSGATALSAVVEKLRDAEVKGVSEGEA